MATATVVNSSGDALFNNDLGAHGLSDNQRVYITSVIEQYNGFWYVDVIATNTFKIRETLTGDYVAFIQSKVVTYEVSTSTIKWSAVHLPIVYTLTSDKFPVNTSDTARTVSSTSNDTGLFNLNLSGSLGTFEELDRIKIEGATSEEVNGIWQIVDKIANDDITINLAYNSQYSFAGGTVILYYNNYHMRVRVYAGLESSHPWYSMKPYELATTLFLIPDSSNEMKFSINEILKAYVKQENNLLLGTLPNNLDAFVGFYISYAESYDQSNGYSVGTFVDTFTNDAFEGYAVNAMLPFKNIYSGHMSEYVMKNGLLGLFLTAFVVPVLFSCDDDTCYQDVSFILERGLGVDVSDLSSYQNGDDGDEDWSLGSTPSVTVSTAGNPSSEILYIPVSVTEGADYEFLFDVDVTENSGSGGIRIYFRFYDSGFSSVESSHIPFTSTSIGNTGSVTLTATDNVAYLGIEIGAIIPPLGAYNYTVQINSFSFVPANYFFRELYYSGGVLMDTIDTDITNEGDGVYRQQLSNPSCAYDSVSIYVFITQGIYDTEVQISETKTLTVDCNCSDYELRLCWQNNLGGFDYWNFTAGKDHITNIDQSQQRNVNTFTNWPRSWGQFSDTGKRKQTSRDSNKRVRVRSQAMTLAQLQGVKTIKESILVQIINSRYDRRTVIPDASTYTEYQEQESKLHYIEFDIDYTDDNPVQKA